MTPKLNYSSGILLEHLVASLILMQGLGETEELPRGDTLCSVLTATIHPDIKRTLVGMSKRTGMTVSQVTDEVLYTGLLEMQELDAPAE